MITYVNPDAIEDQSIDWSKLKNIPEFTPASDHVIGKGEAENSAILEGEYDGYSNKGYLYYNGLNCFFIDSKKNGNMTGNLI